MSATDDAGPRSPIAGQVAIVTGGAAGIGAAICARLEAAGAQVVVADDEVAGMVVYIAASHGARPNGATLWSEPHVELA